MQNKNKLRQLFCRHHYVNKRNIYGFGAYYFGYRTIYKCSKCGKEIFSNEYEEHGEIIDL